MPESGSGHNAFDSPALAAMLCEMAATLLHVPQVEETADLFDLGADSLDAARLVCQVESAIGVEIDLTDVLSSRSVQSLAALVAIRIAASASAAGDSRGPLPHKRFEELS